MLPRAEAHTSDEREFPFTERDFQFLARLANSKTGIVLEANKRNMIYSRLARRLRALHLTNFSDYCRLLETNAGESEMVHLVNAITTNLTHFFRESHHFDHLKKHLTSLKKTRIRIWSAGCSSGMEPYSIAMTAKEALESRKCDIKILATDIDTNMLDRGRKGEYADDEYKNIPMRYHNDVTTDDSTNTMQMDASLRNLITFNHLNLLESWPMKGPFDAIFCRNVVIYFDKATQATLFNRMATLLTDDGFLYIGHSENLNKVTNKFELIGRTIYRKLG